MVICIIIYDAESTKNSNVQDTCAEWILRMTKFCIDGDVFIYAPISRMPWSICDNLQSEPLDDNTEWKKAQYKPVLVYRGD